MKYCSYCGRGIPDEAKFCTFCGATSNFQQSPPPQNSQTPPQQPNQNVYNVNNNYYQDNYPYKSKIAALLLCIFLGEIGIHRFYVGKVGTGFLYLFTGGLCGIGWIVDIITIATGSFKDSSGMPLK